MKLLEKLKRFNFLKFFLHREIRSLKKDIDFSVDMIEYYQDIIDESEEAIVNAKAQIEMYHQDIATYKIKIKDIERI